MSRILSSPAVPPFVAPVNRQVQRGQGNQQQNLFALLSFLNQQQQQETVTDLRQQQLEESRRRNKKEEQIQEASLARGDARLRLSASQSKAEGRGKREKARIFREEVLPAYDKSFDKVFSTLRLTLKDLNSRSTGEEIDQAVRKLDLIVSRESAKGGFHSHGAFTAAQQMMFRIAEIIPKAVENPVFRTLQLKMDERSIRSKIIPRSSLPQFVPTSDELRPRFDLIDDQVRLVREGMTDIALGVSPTDAVGQRNVSRQLRKAERFSFDRSPLSVEETPGPTPSLAPIFPTGLDIEPTAPESTFRERTEELQADILEPGERPGAEPTIFGQFGREAAARGVGVPSVALEAGKGLLNFLNPEVSTVQSFFQSPFGTVGSVREGSASPNSGLFSDFFDLSDILGGPRRPSLQDISVESENRTRSSPALQIGKDPFPGQSSLGMSPDEFLRQITGQTEEENEIQKLFSLIQR